MRRLVNWISVAAVSLALLISTAAFGQNSSSLKVNIPFAFTAGGKVFQPGNYVFVKPKTGSIVLSSDDGRTNMNLPIITSLARSGPNDDHLLAFDKVGDQRVLSEVWLPGKEGAMVFMEKGEHEHQLIKLVPEKSKTR